MISYGFECSSFSKLKTYILDLHIAFSKWVSFLSCFHDVSVYWGGQKKVHRLGGLNTEIHPHCSEAGSPRSGSGRVDFWWELFSQLDILNWQKESVLVLSSSNMGTTGLWLHSVASVNCCHLTGRFSKWGYIGVPASSMNLEMGDTDNKMLIYEF